MPGCTQTWSPSLPLFKPDPNTGCAANLKHFSPSPLPSLAPGVSWARRSRDRADWPAQSPPAANCPQVLHQGDQLLPLTPVGFPSIKASPRGRQAAGSQQSVRRAFGGLCWKRIMVFSNTFKLVLFSYLPSEFHLLFLCTVLLKGLWLLGGALEELCV